MTGNAKLFESGNNFHLEPSAIWNKDKTQKRKKFHNLDQSFPDENLRLIRCQFISALSKEKSFKLKDVKLSDVPIWVY